MDDMAKLNSLAKAEIDALFSEGITPTPEEIVEINALAWSVHTPETRRLLSRGRPVYCGGAWLWPLTMLAVEWLQDNRVDLSIISPAIGYAMAHGRSDGGEMDSNGRQAEADVKRWWRGLRCTPEEFRECVRQVDAQDAKPDLPTNPDGHPMTMGDLCAFLSATCGADADFWERRCSLGHVLAVVAAVVQQNHADKRPCAHDPRIIAERALGFSIEKIKARHKAEAVMHG
jgi:hypothetical protein